LHWLQDPSEINGDNLNNVRCEASKHFRNTKSKYLKDKINELATNSKDKNKRDLYEGINEFKRGHQPRNNLVRYKNLLSDSQNILKRWKNFHVTWGTCTHSMARPRVADGGTASRYGG
jgi:hypothetical protein